MGGVRFGSFVLDRSRRRLLRDGRPVVVTAKAFDLLVLLVEAHERVVPRAEIFDRLWPNTAVADNNLSQQIHRLRRILGPYDGDNTPIRTIPNRGVQFVGAVEPFDVEAFVAISETADHGECHASLSSWPVAPDPLIGRAAELGAVLTLLRLEPLVTLTGPGGIGKTRLAVEAGRRFASEVAGGVHWVDVTQASQPGDLVPLVARTVGLADTGRRPLLARIRDWLADTDALIVFDNFEHLLAAAPTLAEMRSANTDARFLVTSRAVLRVRGEREYAVPPLRWGPDSNADEAELSPAVRLFIDRRGGRDTAGVAALCERLDGLPLAIELAAARAKYVSVADLLERDRLVSILPAGPRDAPARQQTLRRTLEWSYALLTPNEQYALRCLAVFAGGFSAEAAAALLVATGAVGREADGLDLVTTLREHSLAAFSGRSPSGRLRLLETVREFCLDLITPDERRTISRAHVDWLSACLVRETPALRTSMDGPAMDRLLLEQANLEAGLLWCADTGDLPRLAALATDAAWFFHTANLFEKGRAWTARVVDVTVTSDVGVGIDRRRLLAMDALLAFHTADFETTARLAAAVLSEGPRDFSRGLASALQAGLAAYSGDQETAWTRCQDTLRVAGALSDRWLEGLAALMLAFAAAGAGDYERAYARLRDAPAGLGFLSVWIAINTHFLEVVTGRLDDAQGGFRRILGQRYGAYRPIRQLTGGLEGLAYFCDRRGDVERGALLLASADRWRRETAPLLPMWHAEHERALSNVRQALGDRFDPIWNEGAALTLDEAIDLGLSLAAGG